MRLSLPMKKSGETVLFKPSPPKPRCWQSLEPVRSSWCMAAILECLEICCKTLLIRQRFLDAIELDDVASRANCIRQAARKSSAGSPALSSPEIGFIIGEPKNGSMALSLRVVVGMELLWC